MDPEGVRLEIRVCQLILQNCLWKCSPTLSSPLESSPINSIMDIERRHNSWWNICARCEDIKLALSRQLYYFAEAGECYQLDLMDKGGRGVCLLSLLICMDIQSLRGPQQRVYYLSYLFCNSRWLSLSLSLSLPNVVHTLPGLMFRRDYIVKIKVEKYL